MAAARAAAASRLTDESISSAEYPGLGVPGESLGAGEPFAGAAGGGGGSEVGWLEAVWSRGVSTWPLAAPPAVTDPPLASPLASATMRGVPMCTGAVGGADIPFSGGAVAGWAGSDTEADATVCARFTSLGSWGGEAVVAFEAAP